VKAIQIHREIGYPYMLMPDHVPEGLQSFTFGYGYIRGVIQSLG
jgi:mannonate dehydratase